MRTFQKYCFYVNVVLLGVLAFREFPSRDMGVILLGSFVFHLTLLFFGIAAWRQVNRPPGDHVGNNLIDQEVRTLELTSQPSRNLVVLRLEVVGLILQILLYLAYIGYTVYTITLLKTFSDQMGTTGVESSFNEVISGYLIHLTLGFLAIMLPAFALFFVVRCIRQRPDVEPENLQSAEL